MFRRILVPLDGSATAEQSIPVAVSLARGARAAIDLVRVHQPLRVKTLEVFQKLEQARWHADTDYLTLMAEETHRTVDLPVTQAVLSGNPVAVICARAFDQRADLVVMTSHGRTGFSRAWLGSVADGVARRAAVPVLMLRITDGAEGHARNVPAFGRILVPLDGSSHSETVLDSAAALAQSSGGTLVLLRVVPPVPMGGVQHVDVAVGAAFETQPATQVLAREAERELDTAVRTLAGHGISGVERHIIVEQGVARAILDFADRHRVDLIAMTTHGRGASRLLIGSIADKLLRGSTLPILLLRPAFQLEESMLKQGEIEQQLAAI